MSLTRRQSGLALIAAVGAGALGGPRMAWAAKPTASDDDDDEFPNVFISPCGEPFRARLGDPYPVAAWFKQADKNGDGKLDHGEFVADAERFFKVLDLNKDGLLSRREILVYEYLIAPEIVGGRVRVSEAGAARLWLAQIHSPGPIDPSGDNPDQTAPPHPKTLDESGQGAAPYSFFEEPEPILTADLDVNGIISKANFLKIAGMHFEFLDPEHTGFLTLAGLPKTSIQKILEKTRHKPRRS